MNDTGSDLLSLYSTDLLYLGGDIGGNIQGYRGQVEPTSVVDANGIIRVWPTYLVQVRLARDDYTPWSDWIVEVAIVRPPSPYLLRLSGIGIRHELYFGTSPNNLHLAVSATKGGLTSLL